MSNHISKTIVTNNRISDTLKNYAAVAVEFDRVAPEYETNRLASWYKAHGNIIQEALTNLSVGSILDIGCGTGWLLRQIVKYNKHITGIGIDISCNMIDVAKNLAAKEKIENLNFIQGNWEDMDLSVLSGKNIKIILCASAFHYFADPTAAANRMFESLCKGGHFYLLERDKANSNLTALWDILHKFIIKDHVRFYHFNELNNFFKNAGFSDILVQKKIHKLFWKNKLYTSMVLLSGHKK